MSDRWSDRLSLYLDGDLGPREIAEIEKHLDGCAECSSTLAALREVATRANALEDRLPDLDLWPTIRGRLAEAPKRRPFEFPRFALPRHVHFTLPQALAAGFALVVISGSAMWFYLRQGAPVSTAPRGAANGSIAARNPGAEPGSTLAGSPGATATEAPAPSQTTSPGASATNASVAAVGFDPGYDRAIADLENTVATHRSELDTSTVRIVEQNLAIIDRAIVQAQRALAADPASAYLHQHLALQRQLKLDLLRRTAALVVAQG